MSPALLVAALHGIAHFEKEDAPDDNSQPYQEMHRATPFGSEDPILVDTPAAALKSLPLDRLSKIVTPERRRWLADMRGCMAQGIADTRRPQNDITLWDWGYTVASLTKAAAAWLFKTKPESLDFTRRDWLAWRTLRVSLDILGLYQQSDTIRDLLGIGDALKKSFEAVQTLLEETYALANRFYHDETGAYYLFPNFDRDDELLQEIRGCFPPDLQPQIHLEAPVNGAQLDPWNKTYDYVEAAANLVANPRKSALKIRQEPVQWDNNLYSWGKEWLKDRPPNAEICTVCGFRPVGYPPKNSEAEATLEPELASWATFDKAKERNLCRVCLTRRGRRSQEWAERSFQGTVWTSEVADNHGRLALLVGRLGLEGWLDGVLFSTIMIKGDSPKAPSPTRLYRVAETGRRFWERAWNVIAPAVVNHRRTFRLALHPEDAAWDWLTAKLGPYHAYELQWEGKTLEVVWDAPRSRFVTVENLEYFVKRHKLKDEEWIEKLGQAKCQLREPGTAGRKSQPLNSVQIIKYEKLDAYVPVIPLLAEPMVGLSLVPADKALDLVQAICRAYMDQMARVRDRLPLHLGLVFFPRRAPMRAVLEAGRAMLKMGDKKVEEWWGIVQAETVNDKRRLIFDNGVVWEVPLCSGDGTVLDKWYPHFRFCPSIQNEPPIIESKHVKDLKARDSKTPPDKRPKVCISPSRFDFEFLDITGRRFEISYDVSGRRWSRPTRPFLLDNLDRLEALWKQMQDLSITQRYQVVQAIEATREAWFGQDGRLALLEKDEEKGTFRQFVRDTLAGAAWRKTSWEKISPEIRQQLEDAGVTGELADLAELHLQILKEKESKGADNHGDF
ncbi:MAG: hypothetical protein FJ134_01410 [Deltaproteobacteria bacterium]|nr:hypothetical protein [Deltaproteobacteria bacterium]